MNFCSQKECWLEETHHSPQKPLLPIQHSLSLFPISPPNHSNHAPMPRSPTFIIMDDLSKLQVSLESGPFQRNDHARAREDKGHILRKILSNAP